MIGILLIQLGTPDSPTPRALRRFLREFLMDPRVIDIPSFFRFLLVQGLVVPFRSSKSAQAYASVWSDRGSPLRMHTEDLALGLSENFKSRAPIEIGMRYGSPSIADAWKRLKAKGVSHVMIAPLYPQYASASTGSSLEEATRVLSEEWCIPKISTLAPFYERKEFIEAFASGVDSDRLKSCDHFLMSFHGVPERHILKGDPEGSCCLKSEDCCRVENSVNMNCYRRQCIKTAEALSERLGIPRSKWTLCFQSRLGRTPWLKPYTDLVLGDLAQKGVKRLGVFSPSFVADCLETLEELGIRAKSDFKSFGGDDLILFPCPNASRTWVSGLTRLLEEAI